jgi:hypothetical protein
MEEANEDVEYLCLRLSCAPQARLVAVRTNLSAQKSILIQKDDSDALLPSDPPGEVLRRYRSEPVTVPADGIQMSAERQLPPALLTRGITVVKKFKLQSSYSISRSDESMSAEQQEGFISSRHNQNLRLMYLDLVDDTCTRRRTNTVLTSSMENGGLPVREEINIREAINAQFSRSSGKAERGL